MMELVRSAARACSCGEKRSDSNEDREADEPSVLLFEDGSQITGVAEEHTPVVEPTPAFSGQEVCKVMSLSQGGRIWAMGGSMAVAGSLGIERSVTVTSDPEEFLALRRDSARDSGSASVGGESMVSEGGFSNASSGSAIMVASKSSIAFKYSPAPVTLERVYDFYDPSEGVSRVVNMSGDVIHRRLSSVVGSVCGSEEFISDDSNSEKEPTTDQQRKCVTNWGILVGKAIWCRVHGKLDGKLKRRNGHVGLNTLSVSRLASCYFDMKRASMTDGMVDEDKKFCTTVHKTRHAKLMASNRAKVVVSHAKELAKRIVKEPHDCMDFDWVCEDLMTFLFSAEYADTIMILAKGARSVVASQPILVEVSAPCRIFGDTHGQLRDLLLLFRAFGMLDADAKTSFVFNGDFVDRGKHQLEVVSLLFALKCLYPTRVFLIRGNHEDREMNRRYGFQEACNKHLGAELGPKTFEMIHEAFDYLPLAANIGKRILVLHGGIGNGKWRLEDLLSIRRPLKSEIYSPSNAWIFNILWSDPIEDDDRKSGGVFGVHGSPRNSKVFQFGWNITEQFCAQNGLHLIVRSHQCKEGGYGFDIMHNDKLIRVFSARDYERHGNDCAVLLVTRRNDTVDGDALLVRPQVLRSVAKPGWSERVAMEGDAARQRSAEKNKK